MNILGPWIERGVFPEFLINCFVTTTLLLGSAFLLDLFARLAKQLLWRSTIWNSTLIGLFVLPLFLWFPPPIGIEFSDTRSTFPPIKQRVHSVRETPVENQSRESSQPPNDSPSQVYDPAEESHAVSENRSDSTTALNVVGAESSIMMDHAIWAVYVIFILVGVVRLIADLSKLNGLQNTATCCRDERWSAIRRKCCHRIRLSREPQLLTSDIISSPMVVGILRPCILLPVSLKRPNVNETLIECILLHELTHIKRRDCQWQMLFRLLTIVFWFQPLLRISCRIQSAVRERICDQYSVAMIGNQETYVNALIEMAEQVISNRKPRLALSMVAKPKLEKRIDALFGAKSVNQCVASKRVTFLCLTMTLSLLVLFVGEGRPQGGSVQGVSPIKDSALTNVLGKDRFGDPLPESAITRLGTLRFRNVSFVRSTAISADGTKVASVTAYENVRIWDTQTGSLLHEFKPDAKPAYVTSPLCFSPDCKLIAFGQMDGTIKIWSIEDARLIHSIAIERNNLRVGATSNGVTGLTFSSDGKIIVAAHRTGIVRLLNVETGKREAFVDAGKTSPLDYKVAISADSKFLASSMYHFNRGGRIQVWRVGDLSEPLQMDLRPGAEPVSLAFDPHTNQLFVGCKVNGQQRRTNEVSIWDPHSGKSIGTLDDDGGIGSLVSFSRDGSTMVTANDGQAAIWDNRKRIIKTRVRSDGRWYKITRGPISLSANGLLGVMTLGHYNTINVVNCQTGKPLHPEFVPNRRPSYFINFDRSGKHVVAFDSDYALTFWDVKTGKLTKRLEVSEKTSRTRLRSADGRFFARILEDDNASEQKTVIQIWDLKFGEMIREDSVAGKVSAAAISPDGKLIATSSRIDKDERHGALRGEKKHVLTQLWEVESGELVSRWEGRNFPLTTLVFNRESNSLSWVNNKNASGRWDFHGEVETRSNTIAQPYNGLQHRYKAYSSDRKTLVESAQDGAIIVTELETGATLLKFQIPNTDQNSLAISHDDQILATAGSRSLRSESDNAIYLWSLATGERIAKVGMPDSVVTCLAFSKDDRMLVSGTGMGTVLVWSLEKHMPATR